MKIEEKYYDFLTRIVKNDVPMRKRYINQFDKNTRDITKISIYLFKWQKQVSHIK